MGVPGRARGERAGAARRCHHRRAQQVKSDPELSAACDVAVVLARYTPAPFRAELSPSACGLGAPRVPTIRLFAFRAHMHCLLSVDRLVEERVLAALLSVEFLSCVSVWCYGPVGRCLYSVSYFVHKDL